MPANPDSAAESDLSAALRHHCSHYASVLRHADRELRGPRQPAALHVLRSEHDNLMAAVDQVLKQQYWDTMLSFAQSFSDYFEMSNRYGDGLRVFAQLRSAGESGGGDGLSCWAGLGLGQTLYLRGEFAAAQEALESALTLASRSGDTTAEQVGLARLGRLHLVAGRLPEARDLLARALAAAQLAEDAYAEASAASALATAERDSGNLAAAHRQYTEALELTLRTGSPFALMRLLPQLGVCEFLRGNIHEGRRLHLRSLELNAAIGDIQHEAAILHNLGMMALQLGDSATARCDFERCAAGYSHAGDLHGLASVELSLCDLALAGDDFEAAAAHLERALSLGRQLHFSGPDVTALVLRLSRVESGLGAPGAARRSLDYVDGQVAAGSFTPQGDEAEWIGAVRARLGGPGGEDAMSPALDALQQAARELAGHGTAETADIFDSLLKTL